MNLLLHDRASFVSVSPIKMQKAVPAVCAKPRVFEWKSLRPGCPALGCETLHSPSKAVPSTSTRVNFFDVVRADCRQEWQCRFLTPVLLRLGKGTQQFSLTFRSSRLSQVVPPVKLVHFWCSGFLRGEAPLLCSLSLHVAPISLWFHPYQTRFQVPGLKTS